MSVTAGLAVQFTPKPWLRGLEVGFARLNPALQGAALAVVLLVVDVLGTDGVAAFIYFQF